MRFCVYYLTRVMLFAAFLLGLKIFLDLLHQTNIIEYAYFDISRIIVEALYTVTYEVFICFQI